MEQNSCMFQNFFDTQWASPCKKPHIRNFEIWVLCKTGVNLYSTDIYCDKFLISALLSKNKEVVGENNSAAPTVLYTLTPA